MKFLFLEHVQFLALQSGEIMSSMWSREKPRKGGREAGEHRKRRKLRGRNNSCANNRCAISNSSISLQMSKPILSLMFQKKNPKERPLLVHSTFFVNYFIFNFVQPTLSHILKYARASLLLPSSFLTLFRHFLIPVV